MMKNVTIPLCAMVLAAGASSADVKPGSALDFSFICGVDALAAALFENGIYVTTDLYVSRRVPYRHGGMDMDGSFEMQAFKEAVRTNDVARENLVRFMNERLT